MRSAVVFLTLALTPVAQSSEFVQNQRFCSSNGEFCAVVRQYARIGDFDRVPYEEYWRTDPIEECLAEYPDEGESLEPPPPPEPTRAAMYRILPSGNPELLYELVPESTLLFVTNDGALVTTQPVACDRNAKLLTVRSLEGAIVRTLNVRDVFTPHDQLWLCSGRDAVRWSLGSALQAHVLVTDTIRDAPESRFATVEIDLDERHPAPERDFCPDVVRIAADPGAILPSAIHREMPEYPVVAIKARISGVVRAQLVIGRDGTVTSVTITKPLPFGLDEAVRTALRQWTFEPQPEPFTGEIAFRFEVLRAPVIEVTTTSCFRTSPTAPAPRRSPPSASPGRARPRTTAR